MSVNKQSEQREGLSNVNIDFKKQSTDSQIDVYSSLLEGRWHQSLAKTDKIKFLNESKQTRTSKNINMVQTPCSLMCVIFDMTLILLSNGSALT